MDNLIQSTIEKIKKQHIEPEPRWKYLARKYGLWAIFSAIVILAAVSLSVAYDNARGLDWDLYGFMHESRAVYYLSIIPHFWIAFIVIFLAAAFFEIRKTETGYRYSWLKISAVTIGGVLVIGIILTFFGWGGRMHSRMAGSFPYYARHMVVTKESQWTRPELGFLAGTIVAVSENLLKINDLNGDGWNINIDEKTSIRPSVDISPEELIKIIGEKKSEDVFEAKEIRPWVGRGMMGGGRGMMDGSGRNRGMMGN